MKVAVLEKMQDGTLEKLDDREWSLDMIASLEQVNFLLLNGHEYEMIEGRLNVNDQLMELLVIAIPPDIQREGSGEDDEAGPEKIAKFTSRH